MHTSAPRGGARRLSRRRPGRYARPAMKDAASPEVAAAANRVKEGVRELARGAVGAAGDLASDLAEGYRKSTRYFKLRAAMVGTWALLSLVTLWAACPPSDAPRNALGARV